MADVLHYQCQIGLCGGAFLMTNLQFLHSSLPCRSFNLNRAQSVVQTIARPGLDLIAAHHDRRTVAANDPATLIIVQLDQGRCGRCVLDPKISQLLWCCAPDDAGLWCDRWLHLDRPDRLRPRRSWRSRRWRVREPIYESADGGSRDLRPFPDLGARPAIGQQPTDVVDLLN